MCQLKKPIEKETIFKNSLTYFWPMFQNENIGQNGLKNT